MSSSEKSPTLVPNPETRKESNSSPTPTQRGSGSAPSQPSEVQQMKPLKCPRCDSPNTKFCYYNNYSLKQPRHFCKTCRRYWTHGGSLRNVPMGGASRKPKTNNNLKPKPKPSSFGSHPAPAHHNLIGAGSSSTMTTTTTTSCGDHIHVAIESLSSINQEMHWKLQHQRVLSLVYDHHHHIDRHHDQLDNHNKLFHNHLGAVGPTEWFIGQTTSYVPDNYSSVTESTEVEAADNPDGWNYLHHQFNGFR